jgi:hypothetical protein
MNLAEDRIQWGDILSKVRNLLIPQEAGNHILKQDSALQNNVV